MDEMDTLLESWLNGNRTGVVAELLEYQRAFVIMFALELDSDDRVILVRMLDNAEAREA